MASDYGSELGLSSDSDSDSDTPMIAKPSTEVNNKQVKAAIELLEQAEQERRTPKPPVPRFDPFANFVPDPITL